ncbi:MAG: hypothetical protein V4642_03590 [Bacteroidota bacterium]
MKIVFFIIVSIILQSNYAFTQDTQELKLESYESSYVGITDDNDDELFMDFKVSVKYPIPFDGLIFNDYLINPFWLADRFNIIIDTIQYKDTLYEHKYIFDHKSFFAFTGRFGQYINTRESAPVVGKRFNPYFFENFKWTETLIDREGYIKGDNSDEDRKFLRSINNTVFSLGFGYAHESNGMDIIDSIAYCNRYLDIQRNDSTANAQEEVNDYISRGWDYVGVDLEFHKMLDTTLYYSIKSQMKFFLNDGKFQGLKEEYNSWEKSQRDYNERGDVNGFNLSFNLSKKFKWAVFSDFYAGVNIESGIYNWIKPELSPHAEIGVSIFEVPVIVWGEYGYRSDLAQFGKKVNSFGIACRLSSFSREFF